MTFQPPKSLVDAVRQKTLVPFVGAGMSVGVVHGLSADKQFPDWNGLILRLASKLDDEQKPSSSAAVRAALPDTMAAAQLAVDNLARPRFIDVMKASFGRARPPVGADLSAIKAIWRLRAPFVITTNYDMVLEWPWDPTEIERIYNDDPTPLGMIDQDPYPLRRIWHIHGSIGRVDTLILTSRQYEQLYPVGDPKRVLYQNAFNRLQGFLSTRSFLFLGFSLTEPVLRRKLQEVLELTVRAAPIKFLLLKAGEADAAKKKDFLDNYNVEIIEFENFGGPMITAIDAMGRAAWGDTLDLSRAGLTAEMEPLVDALLRHASGLTLPPATVARVYNAAKPTGFPHALTGGDGIELLAEAIVTLGNAVRSGDGGLPPLLDFASRLKREVTEPWLSRLQLWLDDSVQRFGADEAERNRLTDLLSPAPAASAPARVHVLVRIAPVSSTPEQWLVHTWSWTGQRTPEALFEAEGRTFKAGDSEALIYDLIDELEARSVDPDNTSIAFVVPSALACEPIHSWRLAASVANDPPIGASYTVTIRPLERLERKSMIRRRFKVAWDELKAHAAKVLSVLDLRAPQSVAGVPTLFVDAALAAKQDLAMTLNKHGVRCVVLRETPCATAMTSLSAVIETTTPAILWYRDSTVAPAVVEAALLQLLQSGSTADLPRRIRDERLQSFLNPAQQQHGMNVTLIWDDADYLPPDIDARARVETT